MTRRLRLSLIVLCVSVLSEIWPVDGQGQGQGQAQQSPRAQQHSRLFPPEDLGLLDAPDRDIWQQPDRIMDALAIAEASVVADVGAGSGWFTIRLARRVGPNGIVFAQDVQPEMLAAISRRVQREGLINVKYALGEGSNPRLPAGQLDAILTVDAYHEIEDRVTMLANMARALKPQGRIGVIDFKLEGGGPGPPTEDRVSPDVVVRDAAQAGLRLLSQETFLQYQYFLIFGKQPTTVSVRPQSSDAAKARQPGRRPGGIRRTHPVSGPVARDRAGSRLPRKPR